MNIFILIEIFVAFLCQFCEMCEKKGKICYCDDICQKFDDCCLTKEYYGEVGSLKKISTCKVFNKEKNSNLWVIDKCQNETHPLNGFCLKDRTDAKPFLKLLIPVIDQRNLIYQNAYCAQCNGESIFQYINVSFRCFNEKKLNLEEPNKIEYNQIPDCIIDPDIIQGKERYCEKKMIKHCPSEFPAIHRDVLNNCTNGTETLVTDGRKSYRNSYCCDCWNVTCVKSYAGSIMPYYFSYLLNFNEWEDNPRNKMYLNQEAPADKYDNSTNNTQFSPLNNFVFYTSFSFTCLSMISLSFLIFLYIMQEGFHNFGGYLTISLCSSLWIVNFLTLLVLNSSIVHSSLCIYISILQHFMALATFGWMAVYSLDLLQTFGLSSANANRRKGLKKFCVYCAICFMFSAGFVSISSIVEFAGPSNSTIKPRYGGDHCWFTNKLGGIVWYFIPVCVLLIWNLGTCVTVFYKILSTARDCRVVHQKDSTSTLWLCIRLTAVFGIGYIFQIFIIFTQNKFLIIFGSILNCLQGLLLTICFAVTKRVYSVISKTLTSITKKESKSSSTTLSTRLQQI